MKPTGSLASILSVLFLLFAPIVGRNSEPLAVGPQTEKRFPPLKVPEGFSATLFACDPSIEYPSVIAVGPRPGSLFVAVDYLTGLGTDIIRRDEIRLIEDTDGDGYADKSSVFAGELNSVQGLAYRDGTLFVMHSPYLTALRDTRGSGKADDRRDLIVGLGLAPEQDQIRLHNANGVTVGHDGWLYLALGDRGCSVKRPEGDRLILEGGGILRCRFDGKDLHVFSRGLRNIYDVALDEDLNVFVRDNENDGGDYKIRVCHSLFGADHGYPYLYRDHPGEALAPLADLALGSSAGSVCYLENRFPEEYRGNLFCCEWGRAVVRYPLKRSGASFASPKEADFAVGDPKDPYGFKPTDLVVDRDGSLLVSDWADGQRPRRGRGRVYRIRCTGNPEKGREDKTHKEDDPANLDSESYFERCRVQMSMERCGREGVQSVMEAMKQGRLGVRARMHAVWLLTGSEGAAARERLLAWAKADPEPRVRVQAIRALADLSDPVLVRHRWTDNPGDPDIAKQIAALGTDDDPRVRLEVILTLGRLRWAKTPGWLQQHLKNPDPATVHAAVWAMRQSGNWAELLPFLNERNETPFRAIVAVAVAEQFDDLLVDGLIDRWKKETDSPRRQEYAQWLMRVWRKPAEWTYWGFRPGSRPAGTVAWERTEKIEGMLDDALTDRDRKLRAAILRGMLAEKIPASISRLGDWLNDENEEETVALLLAAIRLAQTTAGGPGGSILPHLERILKDGRYSTVNRLSAVTCFLQALDSGNEASLLRVAESVEEGPVAAELLRALGSRSSLDSAKLLLKKTASTDAQVRSASLTALIALQNPEIRLVLPKFLADKDARVRSAAVTGTATLGLRSALDEVLKLARDADADVRRASLETLRRLKDPRAVPVMLEALNDMETALKSLDCLSELSGPEQIAPVAQLARRQPSASILAAVGKLVKEWLRRDGLTDSGRMEMEQALADIHGGSGVLLGWHIMGPITEGSVDLVKKLSAEQTLPTGKDPAPGWRMVLSTGNEARVQLGTSKVEETYLAYIEATVGETTPVEFFTTASAPASVRLNGKVVYERERPAVPGPYPDRFDTELVEGRNRILVQLSSARGATEFQLRFRRKSANADRERFTLASLSRAGNPEKGRQLFFNADQSLCMRCHRVGDQGERVGPDLTGLGSRFSKAYIIESILEPSRTIAPSFETVSVELKNGKILDGIKVAYADDSITLVDNETKKHTIQKRNIDSQKKRILSTMPDGLEKRFTEDEFVDLVSYLVSLK